MRQFFMAGALVVAILAGVTELVNARAQRAPLPPPVPGPERAAAIQVIVVGKIEALEKEDVIAPFATIEKATYRVAVITVTEVIKGPKDVKTVRLGFVVPPPNRQPGRRDPWYYLDLPRSFNKGDDGLFYLNKHPKLNFYQAVGDHDFIGRGSTEFNGEVGINKLVAKLGNDLAKGLQSESADERYLSAAALILRYRTHKQLTKLGPIDAEESKQILTALSAGDWKDNSNFGPMRLFLRLGLTNADRWTAPLNSNEYLGAAQGWLKKNADNYRIRWAGP